MEITLELGWAWEETEIKGAGEKKGGSCQRPEINYT